MRCLVLALALVFALPVHAEETLALLVVDGQAVAPEPELLDPAALSFPAARWQAWGVVIPKTLRRKHHLSPQELGVEVVFDEPTLEVRLTLPARLRAAKQVGYVRALPDQVSPAPTGVMVDYDVAAFNDGDNTRVSVGHVARTHVAGGLLTTTGQANWVEGQGEYLRGTTTWRRDFLRSGTSLAVGDVGLAPNGLNDPALLGGVRVGSDRQLTRFGTGLEIPLIGGVADTRSTAEVLVNEHQRATGQVSSGPFELAPSIALPGLNNVEVIQRDAFGREQSFSRSFYAHPDLLRRGNKEWDVAAGSVRTNPTEDHYEGFAAQGSFRYGLTDRWTLGATAQTGKVGNDGGHNLTLHNTLSFGRGGLVQADVSASSREDGARGSAFRLAYEQRRFNWSVTASHTRKSDDYWEISQLQDRAFRIQSQTTAAVAFHPQDQPWRAQVSYSDIQYDNDRRLQQLGVSGSYRRGRSAYFVGALHDLGTGDNQVFVGLRMPLGPGTVMASARSAPQVGPWVEASFSGHTDVAGRDVRYQVGGTWADTSRIHGRVDTRVGGGDLTLEARKGQDQPFMVNGRYTNSVWVGEGGLINGRSYNPYDSFAIAEVPHQAGVEVRGSSRPTTTNPRGTALIRGLPSLTPTPVNIDATQLPIDQQVDDSQRMVVAPRQGGVKVEFPLTPSTVRQFVVRLGDGFAPAGAKVESDAGETFRLAERGVLVLEQPSTRATLTTAHMKCELVLPEEGGEVVCAP
ncbi:fimbria/pilus outer membrane usher protein [Pseudomonas sp. Hp2]|uniref:fimbria/pilus outer membrane usher protein n=1 Tax=Pseudomonas sp. Hp2 TaxID=701189 RepID=UPI00112DC41F|nr:fimbria/pilus outer membrane usher protein [Pseudomonas sp. Hp2]